MADQIQNIKICPRCKRAFQCFEDEGCWCEKLLVSRETLAYLRTRYIDCLCPNCMEDFIQSKTGTN